METMKLFIFVTVAISQVFCTCKPKDVKLVNFEKVRKRSVKFTISVTATKCPGLNEFYYLWKVEEKPGQEVVQTSRSPTLTVDGYKYRSANVFKKSYLIILRISHYPDLTDSSYARNTFSFEPDEMHIKIYGGSEKTHLFGLKLMINARALSRDPSYPPEEDAFAGNICKWTINPKIENFEVTDNLVFIIPGGLLKLGTTYNFTVSVTRTKIPGFIDKKSATQLVEIVSGKVPEINVKCIRNCVNPSHLEPTAFAVECSKNCENSNYIWSITPSIDSKKTDFGNGHDKFLVLENSYKPGVTITVTVKNGESHSSTTLQFVTGIVKGTCNIKPGEGISGVTVFKVHCSGFSSPYGIAVYMIYQQTKEVEDGVLLNADSFKEENEVYLTEGSPAVIKVKVQDNAYLQEEIELSAEVKPFAPQGNTSKAEAIKKLVLIGDHTSVTSYSLEGFSNQAVQMVSALLNAIKESKGMSDSTVKDLHRHLVESLTREKFLRFASSVQLISILRKTQKFKLDSDTLTSRTIGKALRIAAFNTYNMHAKQEEFDIPQYFISNFFTSTLKLASDLIKKVDEVDSILKQETPPEDYDSYDEYVSKKLKITDDLREMATNVIITIQTNGITTLYKDLPDEKEHIFESGSISFKTRRVLLTSLLLDRTISLPNVTTSKVIISKPLIEELQKELDHVDYQFCVFKKNPFWWHRNGSTFNTDFVLFDLFRRSYKINTVKNPFYVHLRTANVPTGKLKGNLTDKRVGVHRVELEPGIALVAVFEASDETYRVTSSDCFCKAEDFSKGIEIKKGANQSERTLIARPVKDKAAIYVCVMKSGPELSYEGDFATFSCAYWDIGNGKWKSDGCEVQEADLKNGSLMVCKCSHVSLFAGQIFVAPNSLNLEVDIDFTIAFVQNRVMVIIVATILFLWFFFLILAHLKDREKMNKNVVHKLDDCIPGDSHVYLIVVFTGMFHDAGTTADVAFQIIGDRAKSRVHLIRCRNVRLLKKNAQDWFVIFTPDYLGKIKRIRIWHNTRGNKPHWYCVRIIVQDFKGGQQYCFSVNKWFSLIWGNGKIYREIEVEEIIARNRKILFLTHAENHLRDKDLWMSIMVRDAQSNFSSKERLSCAVCFVFLTMLASAMFYGVPRNAPADSIDHQSNYYITLHNIIVSIESWLVAAPVGMIIALIFKKSAPRPQKKLKQVSDKP